MNRKPSKTTYIDSYLRKGTLMFWNEKIYIIDSCDLSQFTIDVIENETGNPGKLDYFEVMHDQKRGKEPVFANSITELFQKMREMEQNTKDSRVFSEKGISESLIRKAQDVIVVVEAVDLALKVAIEKARQENKPINLTPVIKDCLASLPKPVSLTTYYAYLARYDANNGVRARIALSYTTIRHHQTQKSPALLHLVDLLLERLYFNRKGIPWRPSRIFRRLQNILSHTGGLWIDPKKCGGLIREDLISELLQTDRSFDFVARNPEKMALMSPAGSISESWFYQRFAYLRQLYDQPDDYSRTAFLRLGHRTQLPHDQAYMDEWQLSIYREHKGLREKLLDLWITWVLEGYARCITGFWVHPSTPNLEVGLAAIKHSIFEKDLRGLLGYQIQMPFGIHKSHSLDNAWMHDSDAYTNLAKELSNNGKFPCMEFTFRPKGQPKYGGIIESAIGTFADAFHSAMDEIVVFFEDNATTNTNKQAQHIVDYITRKTYLLIDEYHHTRHSALGQCPIDCWNEAVNATRGIPKVPCLTDELDRMFWAPVYGDRILKDGQVSLYGMHYVPLGISENKDQLQTYDEQGKVNHFGIHSSPENIGRIAIINHGKWIDDMVALELLGPDGKTLRPVSKLQRKIAQTLSTKTAGTSTEWIRFLGNDQDQIRHIDFPPVRPVERMRDTKQSEEAYQSPDQYWEDLGDSLSGLVPDTEE